jgi:hypothetical protein
VTDQATVTGAHERYRDGLAALADDVVLAEAVGAGAGAALVRHFERFTPGAAAYATLAVGPHAAAPFVRVDAFARRPPAVAPATRLVAVPPAGWLAVTPMLADAPLRVIRDMLERAPRSEVVRYRPGRRCTLRVEGRKGTWFARVGRGASLAHRRTLAVWRAALDGGLAFDVARPLAFDRRRAVAWQEQLMGTPGPVALYGAGGSAVAARMGAAAASLPASATEVDGRADGPACLAEDARAAAVLRAAVPELGPALDELLGRLADLLGRVGDRPRRPVHGDLNPPNWIMGPDRPGLVDFEQLGLGDPELDVATWVVEVEAESDAAVPVGDLVASFTQAYELAGGPLDRRLLAAYRAHRRLWKAVAAARAVRPDGAERAGRRLDATLARLEEELA